MKKECPIQRLDINDLAWPLGRTVPRSGTDSSSRRVAQFDTMGQRYSAKPRHRRCAIRLAEYVFAARVGLWICLLAILVRTHSLPSLLRLLSKGKPHRRQRIPDVNRLLRIAVRVCQLRVFHLPFFPRHCLRQSLVLYHEMRRMGYLPIIHFGVQRQSQNLIGHSWVTLNGRPLMERISLDVFSKLYSYPQKDRISRHYV